MRLENFAVKVLIDFAKQGVKPIAGQRELSAACLPLVHGVGELTLFDDMAVLGDADENDAVEQSLHHLIQLPGCESPVVLENVLRQPPAPFGHLIEELLIDLLAEALLAADARQHGIERTRCDPLLGKFPQLPGVFQIIAVVKPEQLPLLRLALVGAEGGVVEAELLKVRQDDEENFLGVPRVAFGLEDVFGCVKRFRRGLGLDEEFSLASKSEVVIGAALRLTFFNDYLPLVMRQACLVFDIPAERLEKWGDEVHTSLGF